MIYLIRHGRAASYGEDGRIEQIAALAITEPER
jgi:hypothetical protein